MTALARPNPGDSLNAGLKSLIESVAAATIEVGPANAGIDNPGTDSLRKSRRVVGTKEPDVHDRRFRCWLGCDTVNDLLVSRWSTDRQRWKDLSEYEDATARRQHQTSANKPNCFAGSLAAIECLDRFWKF